MTFQQSLKWLQLTHSWSNLKFLFHFRCGCTIFLNEMLQVRFSRPKFCAHRIGCLLGVCSTIISSVLIEAYTSTFKKRRKESWKKELVDMSSRFEPCCRSGWLASHPLQHQDHRHLDPYGSIPFEGSYHRTRHCRPMRTPAW
jgi:hypothetical protein